MLEQERLELKLQEMLRGGWLAYLPFAQAGMRTLTLESYFSGRSTQQCFIPPFLKRDSRPLAVGDAAILVVQYVHALVLRTLHRRPLSALRKAIGHETGCMSLCARQSRQLLGP